MGHPRLPFCLKHYNFYNKYMWKIYIHYTVLGFEPTTFRTWVSSQNHQTRAPDPKAICLSTVLSFCKCQQQQQIIFCSFLKSLSNPSFVSGERKIILCDIYMIIILDLASWRHDDDGDNHGWAKHFLATTVWPDLTTFRHIGKKF